MQSAATPSDSGTAAKAGAAGQASGELQVKVSPRPASRVALELAIPGSLSKASYEAAISKLSGSVKLPGFRKGQGAQAGFAAADWQQKGAGHGPGRPGGNLLSPGPGD